MLLSKSTASWSRKASAIKSHSSPAADCGHSHDIAKAIALGADGVVVGTAELVALGCIRCSRCESGRGCPRGIATTDAELAEDVDLEWGTQRIINLYSAWRKELVAILKRFGMRSVSELRGRTDLLMHLDYTNDVETSK